MAISLALKLKSIVDASLGGDLPPTVSYSPQRLTVSKVDEEVWQLTKGMLRRNKAQLVSQAPTFIDVSNYTWVPDDGQRAGAVIVATDFSAPQNGTADQIPPIHPPCSSLIRPDRSVILRRPPRGLLVSLGDEAVVSARLAKVLSLDLAGEVVVNGQVQPGWGRVCIDHTESILDDSKCCRRISHCAVCGAELFVTDDVFVAGSSARSKRATWIDAFGSGHCATRRHLCVSTEMAHELCMLFPKDKSLRLIPIWTSGSRVTHLVQQILLDCKELALQ